MTVILLYIYYIYLIINIFKYIYMYFKSGLRFCFPNFSGRIPVCLCKILPLIRQCIFKKLHYSLKYVYFITGNIGISLSSCMVLRIWAALLTVHVSLSHPSSPFSGRKKQRMKFKWEKLYIIVFFEHPKAATWPQMLAKPFIYFHILPSCWEESPQLKQKDYKSISHHLSSFSLPCGIPKNY